MRNFGLIGKNISYSFSQKYFTTKFEKLGLTDCNYTNYDYDTIEEAIHTIKNAPNLVGLNATIPYKESILPFLNELSEDAQKIGAVNTISFDKKGNLIGENTDWFGFFHSIKPLLNANYKKALILGTGGASKAIIYAFNQLNIQTQLVSRTTNKHSISYEELNKDIIESCSIIVNCTPLGTFPNIEECPEIPYQFINKNHLVIDLIYNPEETLLLKKAKSQGATIKNGLEMLILQAEKSWEIWNTTII